MGERLGEPLMGLKTTREEPGTDAMQNHFYNGWIHGYYLNSLHYLQQNENFNLQGQILDCIKE